MKVTHGPEGVSFEADANDIKDLLRVLSAGLIESKEEKFLRVLEFMGNERASLGKIASNYYKNSYNLLHDKIPLLISDEGFESNLSDISTVKLTYKHEKNFVKQKIKDLPDKDKSYTQNIIKYKFGGDQKESPYDDHFCYRLTNIITPSTLEFEYCYYTDYINTCEYNFYLFAKAVVDKAEKIESGKVRIKKLKRDLSPFDYKNRYLVPGINTLLVFWDKLNPLMYLHNRNKGTTAEAINVKHVVPAGTFQPIHIDDGNHKSDFSLYTNMMREFGEELKGDRELFHPKGVLENVLERPSISGLDHLIRQVRRGKVYFGGVTFDCLTLKPEILTVMILYREDYEKFIGPINFQENYEGDPFAVKFNKDTLNQYTFDRDMLPAGAGCLYLAHENYDRLIKDMQ